MLELWEPDHKIAIIVRDLTNEQMIQMMVRDSIDEYSTDAWIELENVRVTLDAYARGEIMLPAIPKNTPQRDIVELRHGSGVVRYTKASVATFLGWTRKTNKDGFRPNFACETAFLALDMIAEGLLKPADIKGLSRKMMETLVREQVQIKKSNQAAAERDREQAAAARKAAATVTAPKDKARFEKQAEVYDQQAALNEASATTRAMEFVQPAADAMRNGEGFRAASALAEEFKGPREPRKIRDIDAWVNKIIKDLDAIAGPRSGLAHTTEDVRHFMSKDASTRADLSEDVEAHLRQAVKAAQFRLQQLFLWLDPPAAAATANPATATQRRPRALPPR
jgi:hypothetical protein